MNFDDMKKIIEDSDLNYELLNTQNDGRINSILSEDIIIHHLINLFKEKKYIIPKARHWYDLALIIDEKFYPINIKITTGNTADNLSSKKGMYYALTGINPDEEKGLNNWYNFNEKIVKNYNPHTNKDYYFVVCFKETKKLFFTSLKRIDVLTSNGNNLPFQCNWKNNMQYTKRNVTEQSDYIMRTFISSFKKRIPGLEKLIEWELGGNNE